MNVVVETNFLLELTFMQEEHEACESILQLCEAGRADLVLPAFCIAEAYEVQIRRATRRRQLREEVIREFRELSRSKPYQPEFETFEKVLVLLLRSIDDVDLRLTDIMSRLAHAATFIPLDTSTVSHISEYRTRFGLSPQDAIVFASVLNHLASIPHGDSCFINRNKQDFDNADIHAEVAQHNCKLLFSFAAGASYIEHRLTSSPV
jgi:predicted nucleic acid-binding protein